MSQSHAIDVDSIKQRARALSDAVSHARRAACAAAAASAGSNDISRNQCLADARKRLAAIAIELEQL